MNRRIALGFLVAMVLIASGFVISFYSYVQSGKDTDQVRHTYQVVNSLDNTLSLMKDVQAGARGFMITQDSSFLEPYQVAIASLPGQLNRLRLLVSDNNVQVQRVDKLNQLIQAKLAVTQFRDTKNDLSLMREGKRRMDAIRQHTGVMIDTEQSLMEVEADRQAAHSGTRSSSFLDWRC